MDRTYRYLVGARKRRMRRSAPSIQWREQARLMVDEGKEDWLKKIFILPQRPQYAPPTCVPTRVRPNLCITRSCVSRSVRVPTVCPISCMFHSVCGSPLSVPLGVCPTRYVPDPLGVPLGVCPTQYVSHSACIPLGVYATLCLCHSVCPTRYFPLRSDMLCQRNHYMQYVAD